MDNLFRMIDNCIKADFEEINYWKISRLRNTEFAKQNIEIANRSIRTLSEIRNKLKTKPHENY